MPSRPQQFRAPHEKPRVELRRDYDEHRRERQPWRRWYSSRIWSDSNVGLRASQLRKQPLCETCLAMAPPRLTPATVVHHTLPHRGVWSLFIDAARLASACKRCHDGILQREERAASKG